MRPRAQQHSACIRSFGHRESNLAMLGMYPLVAIAAIVMALLAFNPAYAAELQTAETHYLGPDGSRLPFSSDEEALDFLRTADVVSVAEIPVGVTRPRKVLLEKDGVRAHAVFRDVRIQKERVRLDDGKFVVYLRDDYASEVAAYKLGRILGLKGIPPVVERSIRGKPGSLQLWIENVMTEGERHDRKITPADPERWRRQMFTVAIFDNLINNIDRNVGNMLIDPEWNVWMIDHTRSFGRDYELPDAKRLNRCPPWLWQKLTTLDDRSLVAAMRPYMGRFETDALIERRKRIVASIRKQMQREGEAKVLFGGADGTDPESE